MKERPILFNGPMVRALANGTKTQTRRIVKQSHICESKIQRDAEGALWLHDTYRCPHGVSGDRLWVRETHDINRIGIETFDDGAQRFYAGIVYQADGARLESDISEPMYRALDAKESRGWTPSIHMPRWVSRITLEVTGVRDERLCDISDADAAAEGIESLRGEGEYWKDYQRSPPSIDELVCTSARDSFRTLWDSLATPGADWAANPLVWVIEFKVIEFRRAGYEA